MNKIKVDVITFPQLFNKERRIIIPDYQRPYVWGKNKAEELLRDLKQFFLDEPSPNYYYLGSVLYYFDRPKNTYEIIDGQQRITTLLIIKKLLDGFLPTYQDVEYNSNQSFKFIKEAQTYFQKHIELLRHLQRKKFLSKLQFTLITTHSEDDAFTFFDTQNNRGVKLSAADFLKAYHLREISSETIQDISAKEWEKASTINLEGGFLSFLFDKILWRARNWKGQKKLMFETKDLILDTFQKRALKSDGEDSYPLYPNYYNRHAIKQSWHSDGSLSSTAYSFHIKSATTYPFNLRQPLHKGINFFKYTEKYVAIYNELFDADSTYEEIKQVRTFYRYVYNYDMSQYLRHFMQLCLVMYYDAFGQEKVIKAAMCFDYLLGSIRISKQQVKREAVVNCLKDNTYNLLDIIAQAYLPEEVFQFVYNLEDVDEIYEEEEIEINDGVRGRYKSRVLEYFERDEEYLINRKSWSNQ